jgi:hypothetical protein
MVSRHQFETYLHSVFSILFGRQRCQFFKGTPLSETEVLHSEKNQRQKTRRQAALTGNYDDVCMVPNCAGNRDFLSGKTVQPFPSKQEV